MDDQLIQLARSGNRDAHGAIFQKYQKVILAIAESIVGADAAEDVMQDVAVKLLTRIGDFRGGARQMQQWLVSTTIRLALNLVRDHKRRRDAIDEAFYLQDFQERDELSPEDLLHFAETTEIIMDAIDGMGGNAAAVLRLRLVQGCTPSESADVLGVSIDTEKARYCRALERLRRLLEERAECF